MGNTGSNPNNGSCKSCNTCSEKGLYFGFGKKVELKKQDDKLYAKIKGKQRRVYVDSKGNKYYREGSSRRSLPKGTRTYKTPKELNNKRKVPKDYYLKKQVKSPQRKVVKDSKNRKVGKLGKKKKNSEKSAGPALGAGPAVCYGIRS